MISVSGRIRDIAREIVGANKSDFDIEGINIYFSAPKPTSKETLTEEKKKSMEANFVWNEYAVLFQDKRDNFNIYLTPLQPWGEKQKGGQEVIVSDPKWGMNEKEPPPVSPKEVERVFSSLLRSPDLFPDPKYQTLYVNKSEKGKKYSPMEFERFFNNDFYVVLRKDKTLENPFGEPLGTKGGEPGEKPPEEKQ